MKKATIYSLEDILNGQYYNIVDIEDVTNQYIEDIIEIIGKKGLDTIKIYKDKEEPYPFIWRSLDNIEQEKINKLLNRIKEKNDKGGIK